MSDHDEIKDSWRRFKRLEPAQKLLQEATAAAEVGYIDKFDRLIAQAVKKCPPEEQFLGTIHAVAAQYLHKFGRIDDSIKHYELALPMIGVFKSLETAFRRRAKARKKSGRTQEAIDDMNRIVSLLWLRRTLYDHGLLDQEIDRRKARRMIDGIARKNGSMYAWSYLGDGVPEGTLSASDLKLIEKLCVDNAKI